MYKEMGGFKCLDWSDVVLQANEFGSNYAAIDINFFPCGVKETFQGAKEDNVGKVKSVF